MTSRVADHRQILGILWVIYAIFHIIAGGILFVMANTFFAHLGAMPRPQGGPPLTFLTPLLGFIAILILGKGLLAIAAGMGLLQQAQWARLVTLVSGFLALIDIPLGLALGIYSIWVLLSQGAEQEYAKLAATG